MNGTRPGRMSGRHGWLALLWWAILSPQLLAAVSLPSIFSNHAVFQQDRPLPIWGWAGPGEHVSVALGDRTGEATADEEGRWHVTLPAMEAGGPHTLTVSGKTTVVVEDILVGEVWICSGQSNMEWPLQAAESGPEAIPRARHPSMRFFQIGHSAKPVPQTDVKTTWTVCSPETVARLTAVGYFFGRELLGEVGVPVGLIDSNWGGTRIEPWTPPEGFAAMEKTQPIHEKVLLASPSSEVYQDRLSTYLEEVDRWLDRSKAALAQEEPITPRPAFPTELKALDQRTDPAALYHGMIEPLVPFAIRGVIWYQGESNRLDGHLYYHKMHALVKGWRDVWHQGDFPFYYVQLAPFVYKGLSPRVLPRIWEAQTRALDLPNTAMAVINDVGNLKDIHPRNKRVVGDRLARIALANTYGREDVLWSSPFLKTAHFAQDQAVLTFTHVGDGLQSRDGKPLTWFELVLAGGDIVQAEAHIQGTDTVVVQALDADEIIGVRFAWDQAAEPNLVNSAGLPVGAFRAGDTGPHNTIEALTPLAKGYHTVYQLDIPVSCNYSEKPVAYAINNAAEITVPFDRIGYCLELQKKDAPVKFVFVSMTAFTQDIGKIGVPTVASRAFFQQDVTDLAVASNVEAVPQGEGFGSGNIEFWSSSYGPQNSRRVPGASDKAFDFGDGRARPGRTGYGSMQVHLPAKQSTLFAFNRWGPAGACELGIGNRQEGNPDWTFTSNADSYTVRRLTVLVRLDR